MNIISWLNCLRDAIENLADSKSAKKDITYGNSHNIKRAIRRGIEIPIIFERVGCIWG